MCSYSSYTGRWAMANPNAISERIKLGPHGVSAGSVAGNERYDFFDKSMKKFWPVEEGFCRHGKKTMHVCCNILLVPHAHINPSLALTKAQSSGNMSQIH
jgi:hypothetical protein